MTRFRWTRAPCKSFSDHRNCQTAGPSLRLTIARLPCCIVILLRRGLAQENLHALAARQKFGCRSELLCGGKVLSRRELGIIPSCQNARFTKVAGESFRSCPAVNIKPLIPLQVTNV